METSENKLKLIDKQIEQLVDRIMEASTPAVITKYEQRIDQLEKEKLILQEKLSIEPKNRKTFEELFELAMTFLSNPQKIWRSPRLEHKRTVLKMAFKDRLAYCRKSGLRTPHIALPFKDLSNFSGEKEGMVIPTESKPVK